MQKKMIGNTLLSALLIGFTVFMLAGKATISYSAEQILSGGLDFHMLVLRPTVHIMLRKKQKNYLVNLPVRFLRLLVRHLLILLKSTRMTK